MDPSLFMDDHGTVHRRPHIERYSNLIEIPIIALIPPSPDRNRRVPGNAVSKGEAEDHTNFISRTLKKKGPGYFAGHPNPLKCHPITDNDREEVAYIMADINRTENVARGKAANIAERATKPGQGASKDKGKGKINDVDSEIEEHCDAQEEIVIDTETEQPPKAKKKRRRCGRKKKSTKEEVPVPEPQMSAKAKGKQKAVESNTPEPSNGEGSSAALDELEPSYQEYRGAFTGERNPSNGESSKSATGETKPRIIRDKALEEEKEMIRRIKKFFKEKPGPPPDRSTEGSRIMHESDIPVFTPGTGAFQFNEEIPEPTPGVHGLGDPDYLTYAATVVYDLAQETIQRYVHEHVYTNVDGYDKGAVIGYGNGEFKHIIVPGYPLRNALNTIMWSKCVSPPEYRALRFYGRVIAGAVGASFDGVKISWPYLQRRGMEGFIVDLQDIFEAPLDRQKLRKISHAQLYMEEKARSEGGGSGSGDGNGNGESAGDGGKKGKGHKLKKKKKDKKGKGKSKK